jgi:hypothetical protein
MSGVEERRRYNENIYRQFKRRTDKKIPVMMKVVVGQRGSDDE